MDLEDPKLFAFKNPDADSQKIFEASIKMLEDRAPDLRAMAANLLNHICTYINHESGEEIGSTYKERAKQALTRAITIEKDEAISFHMKVSLDALVNKIPSLPQ